MTTDLSILDPELVEKFADNGFDTPEKIEAASVEELSTTKGVTVKQAKSTKRLLKSLSEVLKESFKPVADEFNRLSMEDYPNEAVVLDINGFQLTVGDFRKLSREFDK